ncbi:MAG TPA: ABC transporter permease [Clostridiaceae bacterium]|nr:ABC transporter permease [Clostridiaceae bacterium]
MIRHTHPRRPMSAPQLKRARYTSKVDPRRIARRSLVSGIILLLIPVILYLLAVFVMPYDPVSMNPRNSFQGPSGQHWFGTDNFGRDIFVRAMAGLPLTLLIAAGTVVIGGCGGLLLGGLAGYYGRWIDYLISRFNDALLSIPAVLTGMLFVAVFGNGIWQVITALGLMFIPSFARVVRGGFMEHRHRDYVKRLRLLGSSGWRIMTRHLFPQIRPRLLSAAAIGFANAILAESSLSFLGLGVPPSSISWGRMLKDAQGFLFQAPWYALFPGLLIVIIVLGAFFVGNGLKRIDR